MVVTRRYVIVVLLLCHPNLLVARAPVGNYLEYLELVYVAPSCWSPFRKLVLCMISELDGLRWVDQSASLVCSSLHDVDPLVKLRSVSRGGLVHKPRFKGRDSVTMHRRDPQRHDLFLQCLTHPGKMIQHDPTTLVGDLL